MSAPLRLVVWFLLVLSIPCLIWYQQTGSLSVYFSSATPPGQLLYVLSKLVGMIALVCIACQMILAFLNKLQWLSLERIGLSHRFFGVMTLVLMMTHFLLFVSAVSLRQDALAWKLLLPDFSDFYHLHLSFGLFALMLMCAVAFTGRLRCSGGKAWTHIVHRFYWISISLAYIHALAVGSESQSPAGLLLYISLGCIVIFLGLAIYVPPLRARMGLSS